MIIRSEFAVVDVGVDDAANGPRLKIEDMQTGRTIYLDALELESLAWAPHSRLEHFMNPSAYRWRDPEDDFVEG